MFKKSLFMKMISVLTLVWSIIFTYLYVMKPWYCRWNATDAEVNMVLPGDMIVPHVDWGYTQAITINAPVTDVWRWLIQIGQGRGGFYSYEMLENILGCDIHNANRIRADLQNLKSGESIKLHPSFPGIPVKVIKPGKIIILGIINENQEDAASWGFNLKKIDDNSTRLIARSRNSYSINPGNIILHHLFIEPASYFMQKRMLIGIKQRAEGAFLSSAPDHIQVLLWIIPFIVFIISIFSILLRKYWVRFFFVGLSTGLILLLLIAWQPQIWIGGVLVFNILTIMIWSFRRA